MTVERFTTLSFSIANGANSRLMKSVISVMVKGWSFVAWFSRVCLKIAFRQLCVPLCGRFGPDEGGVAGYVDRIGTKYAAKWGVQMAGMNFQTDPSMFMISNGNMV